MCNNTNATYGCDELQDVNPDTIFLEPKFNRAIIGITLEGSVLYEHYDVIHIVMEEENCEEDFESWEDYYDWAEERVLNGMVTLLRNCKIRELAPQLVTLRTKNN